jgi:hypothetical protein
MFPQTFFDEPSIKLTSNVKNSTLFLGFNSTQLSMVQFLMMKIIDPNYQSQA